MKWIVKIEGKPDQRIMVVFSPLDGKVFFTGQYHMPKTNSWIDFYEESSLSLNIDLDTIQSLLFSVYEKMDSRIKAYQNIAEGFEIIKVIEIKEE
jgi:hypothetical protein